MKIIHTADWHLGKNIEGRSRLPEQKLFLEDFVRICGEEEPDLILIAGDIYDSYNPPAYAEQLFYDTLKKLSRNGACVTVIIAGNHDNPDRLTASGPLARDHGIIMAGTPGSVVPEGSYGAGNVTESGPGYLHMDLKGEKADLILLPFPSEKRLNEVFLDETEEDLTRAERYEEKIRSIFADLAGHFRPEAFHIIVSHLFVMNSVSDGSERSVALGGSYMVGGGVFPEDADYIALGHIHKPQKVPGLPRARYSGAPIHYNQREINHPNQILAIELTGDTPFIREIPLPVYKPIEIWRCKGVSEAIERCQIHEGEDSWVFLEIETNEYIHEEDIKTMKKLKGDILSIRPLIHGENDTQQYNPGEAEELPFEDLVREFYRRRFGLEMNPESLDLLMDILGEEDK
ncbi:MAG: exonuclease subunit SbcD [Eubacterium sp.]|nr:exonuclease subunit SbcD [Eubacterium sp.]